MILWLWFSIVLLSFCHGRCRVYSFFEVLDEEEFKTGRQDNMLRVWFRNWWSNGWEPRILRLEDSISHPDFTNLIDHFWSLPTVNRKGYELACYLRWLAFFNQGGGVFVDYDMMNFSTGHIPRELGSCGKNSGGKLTSFRMHWPMIMFGGKEGAEKLVNALSQYKYDPEKDLFEGKPHTSDMEIVRKKSKELIDDAKEAPSSLWHFANSARHSIAKHLNEDEAKRFQEISRSDWISITLQVDHVRRRKTGVWAITKPNEALMKLIGPLKLCPGKGSFLDKIVLQSSRLRPTEQPKCDFKIINTIDAHNEPDEVTIFYVEPIHVQLFKRYQESEQESLTFEEFYRKPENQNLLVKSVASECISSSSIMEECLAFAKVKLRSNERVIVGLMNRLEESRILLEYSLGFALPPSATPYRAETIKMNEQQQREIEHLNRIDYDLYYHIVDLWMERLQEVIKIESQLDKYNEPPVLSLDHYISSKVIK